MLCIEHNFKLPRKPDRRHALYIGQSSRKPDWTRIGSTPTKSWLRLWQRRLCGLESWPDCNFVLCCPRSCSLQCRRPARIRPTERILVSGTIIPRTVTRRLVRCAELPSKTSSATNTNYQHDNIGLSAIGWLCAYYQLKIRPCLVLHEVVN